MAILLVGAGCSSGHMRGEWRQAPRSVYFKGADTAKVDAMLKEVAARLPVDDTRQLEAEALAWAHEVAADLGGDFERAMGDPELTVRWKLTMEPPVLEEDPDQANIGASGSWPLQRTELPEGVDILADVHYRLAPWPRRPDHSPHPDLVTVGGDVRLAYYWSDPHRGHAVFCLTEGLAQALAHRLEAVLIEVGHEKGFTVEIWREGLGVRQKVEVYPPPD